MCLRLLQVATIASFGGVGDFGGGGEFGS